MKIFSIAANMHDHNTYDGIIHRQEERYTRRKHNLITDNPHDPLPSREFFTEQFIPAFTLTGVMPAFTCSNLGKQFVLDLLEDQLSDTGFLSFKPKTIWDRYQTPDYYYIDHHQSHAAYAYLTSGFNESDILAIDGQGCTFSCIFVDKSGKIIDLSPKLSIGGLWNLLSQQVGLGYLGAGKLMGLSAYGKYDNRIADVVSLYLRNPIHKLPDYAYSIVMNTEKKDIAYTLQYITTRLVIDTIMQYKTSDNICIAGGVAYNGYLNEEFTKFYTNVHIPPAVGDEGQSIGTYMHANYVLNNSIDIPSVYSGESHTLDPAIFKGINFKKESFDSLSIYIADAISNGKIVGWYQGRSESGNRALGNRSILADPRNPNIKDIINSKIKLREDFRPFAPSVLEEHYKEYFLTNQPSPYMSRIIPVISDKIPGVTHIDKTARIHTVTRESNERFFKLITDFHNITGIPMLLNTSFNCREPIVETPTDAINTFKKCGLDILVIDDYIIEK